ncbi:MAG: M28 family peptidase [Flavobacteriales bacterium]|jgi:carboxypeptidase Q
MIKHLLSFLIFFCTQNCIAQQSDSLFISSIYKEALSNGECYEHLRVLCKDVGHRIAGSAAADSAIEWGINKLKLYAVDSVYKMPVEVPHWVRGSKEVGFYTYSNQKVELEIVALGGSVGTERAIKAGVIEVKSIAELRAMDSSLVVGKIVFFNKAMDPMLINTGAAYGGAYDIRSQGPSEAAKKGAVGCLIRSLTLADDKYAHTGATNYEDNVPKIPAAALSSVDSRELSRLLKEHPQLEFTLHLTCQNFPRKIQANVIGEIRGSEFPEKVIVVGGHLDSWDVGEGAHDDGTGVTQSIEVLRILLALGYKPRHTIRAVLYMNEEFGNDGGKTYARVVAENKEEHIAAIESDGGGLTPLGFNVQGDENDLAQLREWGKLLEPYQLYSFRQGWSGVDIGPLKTDSNVLYGLSVDSQRYFDFHHSNNDVFENVNKREHILGAAAMAALVYLIDQK